MSVITMSMYRYRTRVPGAARGLARVRAVRAQLALQ